mgnify:FL=1
MSDREIARIAPNLNLFLWRPILADPPLYTQSDLRHWVTISDVLDAHEALDLKAAIAEKSATS